MFKAESIAFYNLDLGIFFYERLLTLLAVLDELRVYDN